MLRLYQLEECPYCRRVREKMGELGLAFAVANVPQEREEREEVFALSGQYAVPVLVDEATVIADSQRIITYLEEKYGAR